MITVYTRPDCTLCTATKIWLRRNKIVYTEIDVSADRGAAARVVQLGYTSLPVVETEDDHWSGFREAKLAALKVHHPL